MKTEVLDRGFVEMQAAPTDRLVADAARVCYQSEGNAEADARLIRSLLSRGHTSPFEHAVFRFYVKAPEIVFRQWVRHRMGSFTAQSRRYTEVEEDEFYYPDAYHGSPEDGKIHPVYQDALRRHYLEGLRLYRDAIYNRGIPKEQARLFLPGFAVYSTFVWTVNARSLMNFLRLRTAKEAQWEIRQYAEGIMEMFEHAMPITAAAFKRGAKHE